MVIFLSTLAAFEEFKSQMQQHLSQVEERMVLLEAENRTLKGKIHLSSLIFQFNFILLHTHMISFREVSKHDFLIQANFQICIKIMVLLKRNTTVSLHSVKTLLPMRRTRSTYIGIVYLG